MSKARPGIREEGATDWAKPLRDRLARHQPSNEIDEIVVQVAHRALGKFELTGCLLLFADIAGSISDAAIHDTVVPAMVDGLKSGWSFTFADSSRAACRALAAIHTRLQPDDAKGLTETLTSVLSTTPAFRLEDAFVALAQAIIMSSQLEDGGTAISALLLGFRERALQASSSPIYLGPLGIALAATAERSSEEVRSTVVSVLLNETVAGRWEGIAILAARGIDVGDGTADRYLALQSNRLRRLIDSPDSPNAFGMAVTDDPRLRSYVAHNASANVANEAIDLLMTYLASDSHWSINRAAWVDLLVHLLRAYPERRREAQALITRLARGDYSEPGNISQFFPSHVLSAFRVNLGSGTSLQAKALTVLGALYGDATASDISSIRNVLADATSDSDEQIRLGAIIGIGEAAKSGMHNIGWARRVLSTVLSDISPQVKGNVIAYLMEIARIDEGVERIAE
jgi:hypothetical protein